MMLRLTLDGWYVSRSLTIMMLWLMFLPRSSGQGTIRVDTDFQPQLYFDTRYVRSVLPLMDGRVVLVEHWPESSYFVNRLGCLHGNGARDQGYTVWNAMMDVQGWNDGAFYIHSKVLDARRLHASNGADDTFFSPPATSFVINELDRMAVRPDGKVYLGGKMLMTDMDTGVVVYRNIVRVDLYGALDTAFAPVISNKVNRLISLPDDRLLVAGHHTLVNGVPTPKLYMVHPDGTVDATFNTNFELAMLHDAELLDDGRLLIAGRFVHINVIGPNDSLWVARLLPDGSLDPTFNHGLHAWQEKYNGQFTSVYSLVPLPDGRILMGGSFDEVDGHARGGLAVIDADGHLVMDECAWPGAGLVDDQRGIFLMPDDQGRVYAYGLFQGFADDMDHPQRLGVLRLHTTTVGMEDADTAITPALSIAPVPARDHLRVSLKGARIPADARIELCSLDGRMWRSISLNDPSDHFQVDLQGIAPGTHLLRLITPHGPSYAARFIIVP